jgi:Domain of unknown function (DUF4926)
VKLPNAGNAVIAQEKLRLYLLNAAHRRGGSKASVLLSLGYSIANWQQLEADIRAQHLTAEVELETESEYGDRYEIAAPLTGPNGRSILFRSIWQIDIGTDRPRLITMYPEWCMNIDLYQDVILTTDLPKHGLCAGDVGTVVERHDVPGKEVGYSVEFFDMTGQTVAVVALPISKLRTPTAADRPSARTMAESTTW